MQSEEKKYSNKGPIAWMARNTVAANLMMMIFLIGGYIIAGKVTQEVFPEFSSDIISVAVPYPGASPEEVEQGIILSIEDNIRGLDGVKQVTSTAAEGYGVVYVELLKGIDPNKMLQDVKNEIDSITSFPEDSEKPKVSLIDIRKRVVSLVIFGNQTETALRNLAEEVRDDLLQGKDVTLVELGLARPLEISIEIPSKLLRSYNLTLEEVASKIRQTALELPAGEIKTSSGQILLRTKERRNFGLEYLDIPIKSTNDGSTIVRLKDIAVINDTFKDSDEEARLNGKRAIRVNVFRVGDESPQSVSKAVREYIAAKKNTLPDDIEMLVWDDTSVVYKDRVNLLLKNALMGLTLVLILLGLFLEPRLAFWVTLGIPISILGCFLFVPWTGATINMISLFAFIISLGIIVDDAVVMGENIYEKRQEGLPTLQAAIEGAREVATPVTFAVLTNIVAFMPLFFVPGVSGKFFRQIPAVVVGVFIVSLIESLFILPAHLSHHREPGKIVKKISEPGKVFSKWLEEFISNRYIPFVVFTAKFRYLACSIAIAALLIAVGIVKGGHLKFSFIPRIEADIITAQAILPVGTPIEESRYVEQQLIAASKKALELSEETKITKGVYSQIGRPLVGFGPAPDIASGAGSHIIAVQLSLVPSNQRESTAGEVVQLWRQEIKPIIGLESLNFKYETGAREGQPIELQLTHRSKKMLESAASELADSLRSYSGVFDVDDSVKDGKKQLSLSMKPNAEALGVTSNSLARQVRAFFYGAEALRQQRGRNEVKIMVRLPENERNSLDIIENIVIQTPNKKEIPLKDAAEVKSGFSYTKIDRRDGRRIAPITADVDDKITNANKVVSDLLEKEFPKLQKKYPGLEYLLGGEQQDQKDSIESLGVGFLLSSLAIFTLLAIPFKSYIQPIIVMTAIPFGFIGAVLGHFALGYGLSIISMFGLIALSGVVVNDSLVLVVTANRLREKGHAAYDAIIKAGRRRFRPIVLTSLTTFFGLAPMIFETSVQARFLIPMAISLGFGILFATIIILGLVPAIYLIVEDIKESRLISKAFKSITRSQAS